MRRQAASGQQKSWQTLVRWPAFLLANLALLFVIGVSTVRETYHGWTVDREIQALESQAATLEGNKLKLEELTKELVSADRIEYEARARLGKKKPGERVIVLEGISPSTSWSGDRGSLDLSGSPVVESAPASNPARWWNYFFKQKPAV